MLNSLTEIFTRDLDKLKQELEQYTNEENLWRIDGRVLNSAGNLALHLIGNLNTYIGAEIGNTGYIRDRPLEFSQKNLQREELISRIERTSEMIARVLPKTPQAFLTGECPHEISGMRMSNEFFLIHLATHLAYHLGQINYHRRLLDGQDYGMVGSRKG